MSDDTNDFYTKNLRLTSHEIRNQLSLIDIYTKIIEKTNSENEAVLNSTKTIFSAISNISKLLDDLKYKAQKQIYIYDLSSVVSEVISFAFEMAKQKDITLTFVCDFSYDVKIDKQKFQRVLLNIIKNAVEAFDGSSKSEKYISIVAGKNVLKISNNAKKIDEENQKRIFEEGYTTKNYGNGLGLYICKKDLKEMDCELRLKKSDDNLTEFEIEFCS